VVLSGDAANISTGGATLLTVCFLASLALGTAGRVLNRATAPREITEPFLLG